MYNLFKQGKAIATTTAAAEAPNAFPDGIDAMRRPMEMILDFCGQQQLLPRPLTVDDVFGRVSALLTAQGRGATR